MTKANELNTAFGNHETFDNEIAVEVRDLAMKYRDVDVLKSVDFTVRKGEVLAFLGPNGAGKTTTVEILEGFRARSSGTVSVLGRDPVRGDEHWRSRVGVVLQSWRDHGRWKVRDLLSYQARFYAPYSEPHRSRPRDVDQLLELVGLSEDRKKKIASLSGGQRRRLDLAVGIVGRPELLFLDEPTAGFDPEARRNFHELVHRLAREEDTTILLTTHDLDEAEKIADRILILAGGRVIADGTAEELAARVQSTAEVKWRRGTQRFVQETDNSTAFIRDLLAQHGDEVTNLEVHQADLEDIYLRMVHLHENGQADLNGDMIGIGLPKEIMR
ncbi:ABC transporter ATP-binding protein [Nocardiopsis rhodophaea]|uniref:ABC transporter ATP-binding protein n=1 Tax=Nocardiopsis rhodophaea TaxID=280238 RepID=A0ABN2TB69_9ACTN